jgi:hypothetical protein
VTNQLGEEVELRPGQRDLLACPIDGPAGDVDGQLADPQSVVVSWTPAGPAEGGPDPGDELRDLERLLDVIVGPRLEADHDVDRVTARREHHDRHHRRPPDGAAQLQPVEPGQHHVEQEQVEVAGPELLETGDAVGRGRHLEPGVAQADRGDLADRRVVLDEQDVRVHGSPSGAPVRRASPQYGPMA